MLGFGCVYAIFHFICRLTIYMYHSDNISILIYRGYWRFLCINILNFPQMFFKIHVNCFIKIGENDICWFELFVSFIWLIRIQSIHLVTVSLLLIKDLQHIENLSWYIITLSSPISSEIKVFVPRYFSALNDLYVTFCMYICLCACLFVFSVLFSVTCVIGTPLHWL